MSIESSIESDPNLTKIEGPLEVSLIESLEKESDLASVIASFGDLEKIYKTKGFLTVNENKLTVTTDFAEAKKTQQKVKTYLDSLNSSEQLVENLKMRLWDERLLLSTKSKPSSGITGLLERQNRTHGFMSALTTLGQIQEEKIADKKRYSPVADWPSRKDDKFLHVLPEVKPPVNRPSPVTKVGKHQSVVLNMMEPSLEESISIGSFSVSNGELLLLDVSEIEKLITNLPEEDRQKILKHKKTLDNYYRNKALFTFSTARREFIITEPTTRYTPGQFIAISKTGRKDLLIQAEEAKKKKISSFIQDASTPGIKTIDSFESMSLKREEVRDVLSKVESSIDPFEVVPNRPEIGGIHDILKELPPNSFIGQNSIDASSDSHFQHLQGFVDAPCDLIPAFNAPEQVKFRVKYGADGAIQCSKIRPNSYPGTIYKFTSTMNDKRTRKFLEKIQDDFLAEKNNGSSFNLVGRKKADGTYEYYFILRKSISSHPELQRQAKEQGTTRPGFCELLGIRIAKSQEAFDSIPDKQYEGILQTFSVENRECHTFEEVAKKQMRTFGKVRHNILEAALKGLRSDAETSKMFHCIQLSGSRTKNSAENLMMQAPDDMVPNIVISSNNSKGKTFDELASEVAEKMLLRQGEGKNYGLVAVDENVLETLPEYNRIINNLRVLKGEYVEENSSFKSFLLKHYASEPAMISFILFFSDQEISVLLKDEISRSDIHIHKALLNRSLYHMSLIRQTLEKQSENKQIELILQSNVPNVRFSEYDYGITRLVDMPGERALELVKKREQNILLLGGGEFNIPPKTSAEITGAELFEEKGLRLSFSKILSGSSDKLKEIDYISQVLFETHNPRSTANVKKIMTQLKKWVKQWTNDPRLERHVSTALLTKIEENLLSKVAQKMLPIYKNKGETYSFKQLSMVPDQIPLEFQDEGQIVPCDFSQYKTPSGVTCCQSSSSSMPLMPTGKKIAIIMNGGQAPGVADVATGVILAAGPENEVSVFVRGNEGLLKGESVKASLKDLPSIKSQGGFPGGTTRFALKNKEDIAKAKNHLKGFDGVVFIGGDGSFRHNKQLFIDAGVPVYFCIKTIDGDFQVEDTDLTLGFYTAVEGYGDMIEERKALGQENNQVHFLQVGGRFSGYLSVGTSALLPESSRPNLSLYPEEITQNKWSLKHVVDMCSKTCALRMIHGKSHGVISVAEGIIQSFPETKKIIKAIKTLKTEGKLPADSDIKTELKRNLSKERTSANELSLHDILDALSDDDVRILANPDAIGRVPVAKIDTFAMLGRLADKQIHEWKKDPHKTFATSKGINVEKNIFDQGPLTLDEEEVDLFIKAPIPKFMGTKSNYDQRSRLAKKKDYSNGLLQGMTASSAVLGGLSLDGQKAAIIATSIGKNKTIAISTKVTPGGEEIAPDHPFVKKRNNQRQGDIFI